MQAVTQVVMCPRDPSVETALRCGRCDTPICPRCMVISPAGQRCKDCGRIARNPIYTLSAGYVARAVAVAIVGGIVLGVLWGLASRQVLGFGGFFLGLLLGVALGWVITRAMEFAVNRKRGPVVAGLAMAGIALAFAIQFAFVGQLRIDSLIALAAGAYFCYQKLIRF